MRKKFLIWNLFFSGVKGSFILHWFLFGQTVPLRYEVKWCFAHLYSLGVVNMNLRRRVLFLLKILEIFYITRLSLLNSYIFEVLAPEKMTERFTSANRKIYLFIPFNRKSVWHSIPSSKFSHTLRSENLREMFNVSTSRAYIHLYYQEFSGSLCPSFAATRSKRGYSGTAKNATFLGKSHLVQLFFLPR